MTEFLAAIRTLAFILSQVRAPLLKQLVQPALTVSLLTAAFAGGHILREGDLVLGIRMAFLDSDRQRAERQRALDATIVQAELHHFSDANKLIDQLLESLMQQSGSAARARLDVIHNGVTGLTGTGLLRYDITHSVAAPGRSIGELVSNRPLAEWTDILPDLLAGQCLLRRVGDLRSHAVRARLESIGTTVLLVCPAADVQGKLLGAIVVLWDVGDRPPPDGEELKSLMLLGQRVGAQIAAVLDLRGPPPWPVPKR